MFIDRTHAGDLLAERLIAYKNTNTVVLAVPRGGLPLGAAISKALKVPLGVVLSKKIGHPDNKEYAIGAVSLKSITLDRQAENIPPAYIERAVQEIRKSLKEKQEMYYRRHAPLMLENKTVIITDDGVATGNTLLSTIDLVRKELPEKIVLAIPVAPRSAMEKLKRSPYIDEIICLEIPKHFRAVGAFYEDFDQVTDQEAIAILHAATPK